MSKMEFQDRELIDALLFFGVENDIRKAKDIKWLQEQNVIHSLSIAKKADSNKYFGILKLQQHRIDFIFEQMNNRNTIELNDYEDDEMDSDVEKDWFNKAPRKAPQKQPEAPRSVPNRDLEEFNEQIRKSFNSVSVDGETIARKTGTEKTRAQLDAEYRAKQAQTRNNYNNYERSYNYNSGRIGNPDGVVKAGCVLTIIANIIIMLYVLAFAWLFGAFFVIIALSLQVWTLVANVKTYSGTAKSNTTAGVLGLLFAGFLGGLLTLCGRYFD